MFHVEQISALLAVPAIAITAMAQDESAQIPAPTLAFPISTENTTAQSECQAGLLDLLMGWDESAQNHFQKAVEADNTCAIAYAGLCLTNKSDTQARATLKEVLSQATLLPHETFYIESLLKLAAGHYTDACQDFIARSNQYRADKIAAVWAVILLHSLDISYDPITGEASDKQTEAMQRIVKLCEQYPDDALIAYARAYIEQSAPQISGDAVASAAQAAEAFSAHPAPHHLMGHLLSRTQNYEQAASYFNKAALLASQRGLHLNDSVLWWKSRVCEATALWNADKKKDATSLCQKLNALPLEEESRYTPVGIIRRWEVNLLPLRFLVAEQNVQHKAIAAASQAATPKSPWKHQDYILHVRDCLRAALSAQAKAKQGKPADAQRSLQLAESAKEILDSSYDAIASESPLLITHFFRAQEACTIAINQAKAQLYPHTREIWIQNAESAKKLPALMLPPVIPAP